LKYNVSCMLILHAEDIVGQLSAKTNSKLSVVSRLFMHVERERGNPRSIRGVRSGFVDFV